MLKKIVPITAAVVLLAAVSINNIHALSISAECAILYEAETGTVLYEKNPDRQKLIASTTKIMTALVALENSDCDDVVTIPAQCESVEGSSMYLKAGEKISMKTLLYGLLLESGNDAAVAIAIHTAGSVEKFAELMNSRAQELGCANTHFVNPNGLDADGHYSSARDLAIIMAEAMNNKVFKQIVSTKTFTAEGRTFSNHNKLLWSYEGMAGGKTGYTKSAGRTLVTCAQRNGMTVICVTLNASDDWNDHINLLDSAFNSWELKTICVAGEKIKDVSVISGVKSSVGISALETKKILLQKGSSVTIDLQLPEFVYAEVSEGDIAGKLSAYVDDSEIYSTQLVFSDSVSRNLSEKLSIWERLKKVITGASSFESGKLGK